jgi:hypothetical protein
MIALSGEQSDLLKQLGVVVNETTVKQYAMAHGIGAAGQALTEQQKVMARAGILTEGLAKVSGDLDKTAGSASNQFRKAGGGLSNFATSIGQMLLPAIQVGTGAFNEFLGSTIEAFESNRGMFEGWAGVLTGAMERVAVGIRNWPDVWELAKLAVQEKLINIGEYLAVFPINLGLIADYIANNWTNLLIDAFNAVGSTIHNLGTNIGNLFVATQNFLAGQGWDFEWTPLLDGFQATAEKLPELIKPELTSLADERDQVLARIATKEAKRAEDIAAATTGPAATMAEDVEKKAEKGDQYHATAAVQFGSKEFSSAIVKHANGGTADDKPIKTVAKNSADQLNEVRAQTPILKSIADKLGSPVAAAAL